MIDWSLQNPKKKDFWKKEGVKGNEFIVNPTLKGCHRCSNVRVLLFFLMTVYDGPVFGRLIISTSQHPRCTSVANQPASSACCRSSLCSVSPPSWRNTPCPINTAGRGRYTNRYKYTAFKLPLLRSVTFPTINQFIYFISGGK